MGLTRVLDLSPPVSPRLAVWPGDVPYRREPTRTLAGAEVAEESSIASTLHLGSHADAPSHVLAGGAPIDAIPPGTYVGLCQVVEARVGPGSRVFPQDLLSPVAAPRVLVRTGTYPDPERFTTGFAGLSVELAEHLAGRGVLLVGVDTPSVDPFDDPTLAAHRSLARLGLVWLEGLRLDRAAPGLYTLVAVPLRLEGADASPVRALLLDAPEDLSGSGPGA
ncbi:kynurenine formamidase [Acidobacteria bacterium ACD]|nr:MAG: kynurenine formamidase [Acidobacteriota bacterium]MCE7958444.1 kynurenine formamidase [Acidobacteria bacterium ACB2]MDL1952487.1 kynurenine formamidase [Acidobacteria bacterium ACD]